MNRPWAIPSGVLGVAAAFLLHVSVSFAQNAADPLDVVTKAETVCAADPTSLECALAEARANALMAMAIAEAGNTGDRGFFVQAIRRALTDPSPEIRASAFYALAKLEPDATDTPAIMAALFDPVSNVRGGAWAAAAASSDPAARAVVDRVQIRPRGQGYGADPVPFDPAALGVPIPEDATYLWLTERLRDEGQLQFLTDAAPADVLAHFAPFAAGPPVTPMAASTSHAESSFLFGDFDIPALFADPQVLILPATEARMERMVVVYRDVVFGRTGFAVVQASRQAIVGPPPALATVTEPLPEEDIPEADFTALMDARSGIDPAAPEEETELYLAILSAYGVGAEDYLELYPDGAYAEEMREILAGPRLVLDALSYPETGTITASLRNLPLGSSANLQILRQDEGFPLEDNAVLPDATSGQAVFVLDGQLDPGVHLMVAEVLVEGEEPLVLLHDFSVVGATVELALDKTEFAPGEPIPIRFAGLSGHAKDYLATAPTGSPGSTYLQYAYVDGVREGVVTLAAPTAPGEYEVRAFFRDDASLIRASLPFTVTGGAAPPSAQPDPGTQATATTDPGANTPPQDPVTATAESGISLTMEKPILAPGETIRFTFGGMTGDSQDFIATAPAGSDASAYIKYVYTSGARDGSATLVAPTKEGAYELRAIFARDAGTIQALLPFSVKADVRLTLDKTVFAPGEAITVRFSGLAGATQDYVATARAGSEASAYLNYAYANGAREGSLSLKAPTEPGSYELRAYLQDDPNVVKASLPFTVE